MRVSDKDMEGYARDCVRLAQLATDPELHDQLMQMGRKWLAAAMYEEKAPESDRTRCEAGVGETPVLNAALNCSKSAFGSA